MAKKPNKSTIDIALRDDPRVKDPVMWNRLRIMVEQEACDRAWGCKLYILHRIGFLTTEQREAGDIYQKIVMDHNRWQQEDPDDYPSDELILRRVEKAKSKWQGAIDVLGIGRNVVDWLVMQDNQLSEREQFIARDALQLLANYLRLGIKREQKTLRAVL